MIRSMHLRSPAILAGSTVLLATVLAPFWSVELFSASAVTVTIGRALLGAAGCMLAVAFLLERTQLSLSRAALVVLVSCGALWAWVVVNALVWGCGTCRGELAGFTQLDLLTVLALLSAAFVPAFVSQ